MTEEVFIKILAETKKEISKNENLTKREMSLILQDKLIEKTGYFITEKLQQQIANLAKDKKTIFYTGALHNNYVDHYNNGIREAVDQKFSKENVLSIDITDIDQISEEYAFEQYDLLQQSGINEFPAAIPVENNINEDYLLVLNNPQKEELKIFYDLISYIRSEGYSILVDNFNEETRNQYQIVSKGKVVGKISIGSFGIIKITVSKSETKIVEHIRYNNEIDKIIF